METNAVLNKIAAIERCIKRVKEEYEDNPESLKNFTKQDSIILNLQRACQTAIDLGSYVYSKKKLGLPQDAKDTFIALGENNLISIEVAEKMGKMVGFRNTAIHEYQGINLNIVQSIIEVNLVDFDEFSKGILQLINPNSEEF